MKKTLALILLLAGLTLDAQAETLTWNGAEGRMTWNTSYYYWLQGDEPALYTDGSDVVFGDNGSGEVTLARDLKPASVLVDSSKDYTFSGDGNLVGEGTTLTKSGSGTLTINTANEYKGGTIINSGTLVLGDNKALGTGEVTLGTCTTLDLGGHAIDNDISVIVDYQTRAQLGNGTVNGSISLESFSSLSLNGTVNGSISLGYESDLVLCGDLDGTGAITIMDHYSSLSCNGHILNKDVIVTTLREIDRFYIDAGTINGSIRVAENAEMALRGDLHGTGTVTLEEGASLYCPRTSGSSSTLYKDVILTGSAYLFWASINGNVTVSEGKCLSLMKLDSSIAGTITLGEGASLNMEDLALTLTDGSVVLSGANAQVGGGTLNGNVTVGEDKKLTLSGDLDGTGSITLEDNAMLALNENTLSHDVTLTGDADIGTGTIKGTISVEAGKKLTLLGKLDGEGSISLGDKSTLELLDISILTKDVTLTGDAGIGNGTVNGSISVEAGKKLTLIGYLDGTGSISLGDKATLDLNESTLSKNVSLTGDANIGKGKLDVSLSVDDGKSLTLIGDLTGQGSITLGDNATLSLDNHSISHSVIVDGNNVSIGNGTIGGDLILKENVSFSCDAPSLQLAGSVILYEAATLDLNEHSISKNVILKGSNASIGKGTIGGDLILEENVSFSWDASALQLAGSVILHEAAALTLDNHSISNNVTVNGSNVAISGGTLNGKVTVAEGKSLFLQGNAAINGTMTLGNGSILDMGGAQAKLSKFTFTGQSAAIDNATLIVGGGEKVTLTTNLSGSANISLGNNATLDLSQYTLSNFVTLTENANIGKGTLDVSLSVGKWNSLTLIGDLSGSGIISLGYDASLNLNNHTLSKGVSLNGDASIGNGTVNGSISVDEGKKLTLIGNLDGTGSISLGDNATLDFSVIDVFAHETHLLDTNITLTGDAEILGCRDKAVMQLCSLLRAITVEAGKTLSLKDYITVKSDITLGDKAALDLGGNTALNTVALSGDASIGGGSVDKPLSVGDEKTLTLIGDLSGQGNISLNDDATLDLGQYTLSNSVSLAGDSANIGNGKLNGGLTVGTNKTLTLSSNLSGQGNITLDENATLDLGKHTLSNSVTLAGSSAQIGNGELAGTVSVDTGKTLILNGDLSGKGSISLGDNATLDLGDHSLTNSVTLTGSSAQIGNGKLDVSLSVDNGKSLALFAALGGTGTISLGYDTTLYLNNRTLSVDVTLTGDASIGGGEFNGSLEVGAGNTLSLLGELSGEGSISLGDNATLDLYNHSLSGNVTLTGSNATISNGTVNGNLTAKQGGSAQLSNATIKAGATTVKSLDGADSGLLQEISVSDGLIAGTDRKTSLADGLYIKSEADLLIESMTLTANNEIHVGEHIITLNQVTIDLSQAKYELVGTDYYFQLQDLINCTLEMDDVVFDASALELPSGFNPGVNGIGMDFGDDVTIDPQTAKNLTLLMGGDWSQTMSLVDGKPVFTALVPTPEPTTGVLSLLALSLLAGRRRRRN